MAQTPRVREIQSSDTAWSGQELLRSRITEWALNGERSRRKGHSKPAVSLAGCEG